MARRVRERCRRRKVYVQLGAVYLQLFELHHLQLLPGLSILWVQIQSSGEGSHCSFIPLQTQNTLNVTQCSHQSPLCASFNCITPKLKGKIIIKASHCKLMGKPLGKGSLLGSSSRQSFVVNHDILPPLPPGATGTVSLTLSPASPLPLL